MTENFNWSSFSIGEPYWLSFLALIPFVIWLKNKKHKKQSIKFSTIAPFKASGKSIRVKSMWVPKVLFYLGLSLSIFLNSDSGLTSFKLSSSDSWVLSNW